MTREEIFAAIEEERERQDRLHPGWYPELALAVLAEEVGEVAEVWAAFQQASSFARKIEMRDAMRDEIIQVAAVCVRWLEEDF